MFILLERKVSLGQSSVLCKLSVDVAKGHKLSGLVQHESFYNSLDEKTKAGFPGLGAGNPGPFCRLQVECFLDLTGCLWLPAVLSCSLPPPASKLAGAHAFPLRASQSDCSLLPSALMIFL